MGLISRVSSRTYRLRLENKMANPIFKLKPREGQKWLLGSILWVVVAYSFVQYDDYQQSIRMKEGLIRDQERVKRKLEKFEKNQEEYDKQVAFMQRINEMTKKN